ncbi:MAG: beta-mannosidase [Oscillospiraceae bacterium]|nr:beta-mannosidase [Oscillospiraceae bacterium]
MIKKCKKIASFFCAAVMTVSMCTFSLPSNAEPDGSNVIFHDECENLELLNGMKVWTSIYEKQCPGYSGEGFIYLAGGSAAFTVDAPEDGMYEIKTRYIQILDADARQQTIKVNGKKTMVGFPHAESWTDISFGKFRLNKGENEIEILTEYGYAALDTITVEKAVLPELNIAPELTDPKATKETQGLMNYLCDMYGNHMLSGQQEIYGNGHTEDQPGGYSGEYLLGYESEFEWIKDNFGAYPAIRGFDMMNYNPIYGWDDGTTERIIEWGTERNGIPTVCWHINLPVDFTSYEVGELVDWSEASYKPNKSFSVANASVEGTKEYEYTMLTIDCLAQELLKVQEAGVPILFRPYHEAEGNPGDAWFWWGQDGPEAYKNLWKLLYTTLTEKYDLHNLIWIYNSYTYASSPEWYPGDEWVDIVGYDKYNCVYNRNDGLSNCPNEDAISGTFYDLVDLTNNKKLVAMTENDTVPSLKNMEVEKANWLWFCIWYDNGSDNFLTGEDKNNYDTLKEIYTSDYCITLDELPDWKNYEYQGSAEPDIIPGDLNNDKTVNVFDSILMKKLLMNTEEASDVLAASPEDVDGDGVCTVADLTLLNEYLLGKNVNLTTYKPENV